ncbi:MAG: hypothetical protein GEU78_07360 [Actinobacteria bacterium]|nr:hypothetical protein [Actinomycetota bacterium]
MQKFSARGSRLTFVPLLVFFVIFSGLPLASATLPGSTYDGSDGFLDLGTTANPTDPIQRDPSDDSTYTNNAKEDDENPTFVADSIPKNKTDFTNAYFKFDGTFLYAAWRRTEDPGSADVDFEFNQSTILVNDTPVRTAGDLLVQYAFGGNTSSGVTIYLSEWVTSGDDDECEANSSSVPCWDDKVELTTLDIAEGNISEDREFGELVINTALLSENLGICVNANQVFVKSRSSGSSFVSTLQDVIRPTTFPVNSCGTITAHKFHDLNADGVKGTGDSGLATWTMTLYEESNGTGGLQNTGGDQDTNVTTEQTDASGNAVFGGLLPGTYYVCETLKSDWFNSTSLCSGAIAIAANSSESVSFGNYQKGSIAGQKFHDRDADGVDDGAGEPGLQGWVIFLDANGNGSLDGGETSTTTNANGAYAFNNLEPGTYLVCEVPQNLWTQSAPASGADCGQVSTGHGVELTSGESETGKDFGNYQKVSISGNKFHDHDADGTEDGTDEGVGGFQIKLYRDANDNGVIDAGETPAVATTTTAVETGAYSFADLDPGSYIVCETQQNTWHQSSPSSGPTCPDGTKGWLVDDLLSGSAAAENKDFGNFHKVSLSGIKWEDDNSDGTRALTDDPLPTWEIRLYVDTNGNGNLDDGEPQHASSPQTTAAGTGAYSYTDLDPGDYIVCEVLKSGWTQSYPSASGNEVGCPDGNGYAVTLLSGDAELTGNDFGNWAPGSVEGYKFLDENANTEWDDGEPGLQGWVIWLDVDDDGEFDETVDLSAVTDETGYYKIDGIRPRDDSYRVYEVIPTGGLTWYCSSPSDGTTDLFGFIGISTTCYHDVTIGSRTALTDRNFGNWTPAEKTGVKFEDMDADGVLDETETAPSVSFTIYVDYNDNGTKDAGEPSADTSTGGDNPGSYKITGVNPGTWKIREVAQAGWFCSYPTTTDQHGCYHEDTFGSGDSVPNNNFGNYRNATLEGTKIHDLDADGAENGDDAGLEGWTIFLDGNDNGELDDGEVSTTTDADGDWTISGLTPGTTYTVCEVLPSDWHQSAPATVCYEVTPSSGETVDDLDFLNYQLGAIAGTKWEDLNANGQRNANDGGLAGWEIELYVDENANQLLDDGEPLVDLTETAAAGSYSFGELLPGHYIVCEVMQENWTQSAPATGPDCAGTKGVTVLIGSGDSVEGVDFGNWEEEVLPRRIDREKKNPPPEVLPRRVLPFTGSGMAGWLWIGVSMLATGAALLILNRVRATKRLVTDSYEGS